MSDAAVGSTPAVDDPRLAPALRWGVLGAGWIGGSFADAVRDQDPAAAAAAMHAHVVKVGDVALLRGSPDR